MKNPSPLAGRQTSSNQADDAAMVREAVARYEGPLTLYAARLLGKSGDVERAREIVQDTFLKLWTADRARVNGHLAAWLFRVCRNRALDVGRKEVRMIAVQQEQLERREAAMPAGAEEREEKAAQSHRVFAMLESLPDKQQEVIRLKFQAGLSYQEIASVLDITANHVGVLIHTALKTIRAQMTATDQTALTVKARIQP